MLSLLSAEIIAFHGIRALQVLNLFPRHIDMHVPITGADTAVTDLNLVLVERWNQDFELDACTVAIAVVLSNTNL